LGVWTGESKTTAKVLNKVKKRSSMGTRGLIPRVVEGFVADDGVKVIKEGLEAEVLKSVTGGAEIE